MERPTGVIFEGISEDQPLRLHDLLINALLSFYDPLVVARGGVTAALARLQATRTRIGVDGMTVNELRKDSQRSHGDPPGSAHLGVSFAGDDCGSLGTPGTYQIFWVV